MKIEKRLSAASVSLADRGPDDEGFVRSGRLTLHHRRLAVVDPTPGGRQPLKSLDGRHSLAVNGEIYNFEELLAEAGPAAGLTQGASDSRAVLALRDADWRTLPGRLDGMFAFALHDATDERLLLARDPLGQKPLFIHRAPWGIGFASTLKAAEIIRDLPPMWNSEDGIASYLLGQAAAAPRTLLTEVESLEPGAFLIVSESKEEAGFCAPPAAPPAECFDDLLDRAVRKRLIGAAEPAVLLSGGLDSALVADSLIRISGKKPRAYTLGFADAALDERELAAATATALDLEYETIELEAPGTEELTNLARGLGEPLADSSALCLWTLCGLVAQKHKVAFTGDGGDELFGGYDRHRLAARARSPLGRLLFRAAGVVTSGRRAVKAAACAKAASPAEALYLCQALAASPLLERVVTRPDLLVRIKNDEIRAMEDLMDSRRELTLPQRLLLADRQTNLHRDLLVKADRASMAHGLELRSPLLDRDLGAWQLAAMQKDPSFPAGRKQELRRRLADRLPGAVLNAPKRGFALPLERWMSRGRMRDASREILCTRHFRERGIVHEEGLDLLFREAERRRGLAAEIIYALVMLELGTPGPLSR